MDAAIVQNLKMEYPHETPFHPSCQYPEYSFQEIGPSNAVYESIRTLLFRLGLDKEQFNTENWNPLNRLISPGDEVVIKPNLVRHFNPNGSMVAQITHGSVIRAILDYVHLALKGKGSITIGDAPVQSCIFEKVVEIAGLNPILEYYKKNTAIKVNIVDFRKYAGYPQRTGLINRLNLPGDPKGYTTINLGQFSEFYEIKNDFERFRVTNYEKEKMQKYHNISDHRYVIANSCLQADVIINLPKLKTHCKAGMTGALKNMVGIIGSKDCLPHHKLGSQNEGGDEYLHTDTRKKFVTRLNEAIDTTDKQSLACLLSAMRLLTRASKYVFSHRDNYYDGSWYGNDTIPRTIVDLNKIIKFVDKKGNLQFTPQRKSLTIVDAIIAGENEGPLQPSPKHLGTLIVGENPVEVDLVCSQIMGFDYYRIPTLVHAMNIDNHSLLTKRINEICIQADDRVSLHEVYATYGVDFFPSSGWRGHIEISPHELKRQYL